MLPPATPLPDPAPPALAFVPEEPPLVLVLLALLMLLWLLRMRVTASETRERKTIKPGIMAPRYQSGKAASLFVLEPVSPTDVQNPSLSHAVHSLIVPTAQQYESLHMLDAHASSSEQ